MSSRDVWCTVEYWVCNSKETHGLKIQTNHQGNANDNHNEMLPHTCETGYYSNRTMTTNVGENGDIGNIAHFWWECEVS